MKKIITKTITENIVPLHDLLEQINRGASNFNVRGLSGSARSFLTALLSARMEKTQLVVCPEEREAAAYASDLALFLGKDNVIHYPSLDFLTVDMFALQKEEELARLEALAFMQINTGVVVISMAALMQKVMPFAEFNQYLQIIAVGDTINRDDFCTHLQSGGYKRVSLVEERGEFSIRGNIIDLFPPLGKWPLRMEMLGDEIESIRTFDRTSQRSISSVTTFLVPPASSVIVNSQTLKLAVSNVKRRSDDLSLSRENRSRLVETLQDDLTNSINPIYLPLFYEALDDHVSRPQSRLGSFFDYLPQNTLLILDDPLAIDQAARNTELNMINYCSKLKTVENFIWKKKMHILIMLMLEPPWISSDKFLSQPSDSTQAAPV